MQVDVEGPSGVNGMPAVLIRVADSHRLFQSCGVGWSIRTSHLSGL